MNSDKIWFFIVILEYAYVTVKNMIYETSCLFNNIFYDINYTFIF